jgi:hypothetical protein
MSDNMNRTTWSIRPALFCFVVLIAGGPVAKAQSLPSTFFMKPSGLSSATDADRPLSNSAVEILVRNDSVWIGGGKGLDLTTDGGRSWKHFGETAPFNKEDIAAIAANGKTIWASLAGSEEVEQGTRLPKGLGLVVSTDNGATWKRIDQPQEPVHPDNPKSDTTFTIQYGNNTLKALQITTTYNNITYDLAVTSDAVWTTSFAGGLRKSTDGGKTFTVVPLPPDFLDSMKATDTLSFDVSPVDRPDFWNLKGTAKGMRGHLNHRVFSVYAENDSTLWVGTAGGINYTTDRGFSWRKITYINQPSTISGNFVVAIGKNTIGGVPCIWASTINATEAQEYRAISYTTDNGRTWSTALRGEFVHNFGFKGPIVYATGNNGVYRSDDGGRSWSQYTVFVDEHTRLRATQENCYAAASQSDTVWVANIDGLMKTVDNASSPFGSSWTLLRASQPLASASDAYAYPNPFAPDDEVCRIHYRTDARGTVSIKVYDFAMFHVRTVVQNAPRLPNTEFDEIWDGRTEEGKQVANGLYYIQVKVGDADPVWTKVIALQ